MSKILLTCPRCDRYGFYDQGLKQNVCRGVRPGQERRRLTPAEIQLSRAEAAAGATRAIAAANPGNPLCLRRP